MACPAPVLTQIQTYLDGLPPKGPRGFFPRAGSYGLGASYSAGLVIGSGYLAGSGYLTGSFYTTGSGYLTASGSGYLTGSGSLTGSGYLTGSAGFAYCPASYCGILFLYSIPLFSAEDDSRLD